ncbi:hypothetical protein GWK48_09245 [Metallosphaera tengchongensis]|uniref:Uncharacterized protein n=1 Tax=Metallosphaera tengchongensis TaxID=1532350 RepID=A0A6N0NWE9_9CREN|nr:hypothetical protein [Metallosphaera tengchongensis]QKR00537.1 hypothetical protein GWK48_09245 [Metallosphaera tengchongensis]
MSFSKFIADVSESVFDHYGDKLKALAIFPSDPILMLIILEDVDSISFLARGQIFNHFYKKQRNKTEYRKFIVDNQSDPPVIGLILSPGEVGHFYPIVISTITFGYVVYDPDKILDIKNWKAIEDMGIKFIDLKNIKKGEVLEL